MHIDTPKQAFAARDAHEALLELKQLVEEATKDTHSAELEAFHLGVGGDEYNEVRLTLEGIVARLRSPDRETIAGTPDTGNRRFSLRRGAGLLRGHRGPAPLP